MLLEKNFSALPADEAAMSENASNEWANEPAPKLFKLTTELWHRDDNNTTVQVLGPVITDSNMNVSEFIDQLRLVV